jgi:hypothetical protein
MPRGSRELFLMGYTIVLHLIDCSPQLCSWLNFPCCTDGPPLVANRLTTRYGRVSYTLAASVSTGGGCIVHANITLPNGLATGAKPLGGLRLRLRVPVAYAGKLRSATVGGKAWATLDANAETLDFSAEHLGDQQTVDGMRDIVASFA